MLAAALLAASSCSFFASPPPNEPQDDEPDADSVDEAAAGDADLLGPGARPHPQEATAWHTRVLIATTPQPPGVDVSACAERVRALAAEGQSPEGMLAAEAALGGWVAKDPKLSHFCFYQMAVALDDGLNAPASLFGELAPRFFDGMRGLWILARALDQNAGGTVYFDYLKRRYVQISKEVFGRELEPVAPPLRAVQPAH